jgi:ATP-dependent exoDNAse (exonuclease V) beta subunit
LTSGAATHALQRAEMMIANLLSHPVYEQVCEARVRYFELPFNYDSPAGSLHGVIDVLYQDQDGDWHLLDWKTEWAPAGTAEQVIHGSIPQLAVYWMAVKEAMQLAPQVTVCLLNPKCIARPIAAEDLATGWEAISESGLEPRFK